MPCRPCFIASSSVVSSLSLRKSLRRSWASVVESLLTFRLSGVVLERIVTPRLCDLQDTPLLTKSRFCQKFTAPLRPGSLLKIGLVLPESQPCNDFRFTPPSDSYRPRDPATSPPTSSK